MTYRFVYDGDGNRVSKTKGVLTTNYLVDTNNPTGYAQVLEEIQDTHVVRSYSYGLDLISQTQKLDDGSWQLSFYGYDGHGSVRYLTNAEGNVTDTYDYDAFGNLINSTGTTQNNYLYAGEQFDPDLGLYYNRARYLDVRIGRFWGMDSYEGRIDSPITLNKFLYGNSNPIANVDPLGRFSIGEMSVATSVNQTLESRSTVQYETTKKAIQVPLFDIYAVIGPSSIRLSLGTPFVHAFIYVNTIATGTGVRYDVGANNGLDGVLSGRVPGFVMQSPATLAEVKGSTFTFVKRIAQHNVLQQLSWQGAVRALPVSTDFVAIPYALVPLEGTFNCISWTIEAAIAAKVAERIKF